MASTPKPEREDGPQAREQAALFRRFVEHSSQGLGVSDMEGRIQYANPAMLRMVGVERTEDILGTHFSQFYPSGTRRRIESEIIPEIIRDGTWQGELTLLAKKGRAKIVSIAGFLLRDESGRPSGLAAIMTDVTERRRDELYLRKSHAELQAIHEGMSDGLVVGDVVTRRFLEANSAFCRMLGYTEDEIRKLTVPDIHPPEAMTRVEDSFVALIERRQRIAEELPVLRKDGSVFHADIRAAPIAYRGHHCAVGFFRDVTERIESQRALQRDKDTLHRLLEAMDRDRQLIAYEIHDGLAQMLSAAQMHLQAMERFRPTWSAEAQRALDTAAGHLRDGLAEARRLIADLRPLTVGEEGLAPAIRDLLTHQRHRAGLECQFSTEGNLERLGSGVENTVLRIVQEAVTNAQRHSQSSRIRVELARQGDRLRLEIRDWGIGFDPAEVKEGRFGLHGIQERARLLGGTATVLSQPGQGTRVLVELPLGTG